MFFTQYIRRFSVLFMGLSILSVDGAFAQDVDPECAEAFEVIVPLREPVYDRAYEWIVVDEEPDYDALPYLVQDKKTQDVIGAGSMAVTPKGKGLSNTDIQLHRLNRDGKEIWKKTYERLGDQDVAGLLQFANGGFVVASTETAHGGSYMLLTFIDGLGNKRFDRLYKEAKGSMVVTDVIKVGDRGDVLVSTSVKPRVGASYAQLYRINAQGKQVWKRSYIPSADNRIAGLGYDEKNEILFALGSIRLDDGRQAGLLMSLDMNGALRWKQVYPRGEALILRDIDGDAEAGYVVSGDSRPYAKKDRHAGFAMKVDGVGEVKWQRYFAGRYYYYAHDVKMMDDGRVVVLMDGQPISEFDEGHSRFLVLAENGYLIDDESYIENSDLSVRKFVMDRDGRRYVSGSTREQYGEFDKAEGLVSDQFRHSFIFALPPLPDYKNECGQQDAFEELLP